MDTDISVSDVSVNSEPVSSTVFDSMSQDEPHSDMDSLVASVESNDYNSDSATEVAGVHCEPDTMSCPSLTAGQIGEDCSNRQPQVTGIGVVCIHTQLERGLVMVEDTDSHQEPEKVGKDSQLESQPTGSQPVIRLPLWHRDYVCTGIVCCPGCRQCLKRKCTKTILHNVSSHPDPI